MWSLWLTVTSTLISLSVAEPCVTPFGLRSQCVPIYQCPAVMSVIANGLDQPTVDLLQRSRCNNGIQNPKICCGPLSDEIYSTEMTVTSSAMEKFDEDSVLPQNDQCGFEPLTDGDRILSGSRTQIGEFPWLALLWYRRNSNLQLGHKCGGMLINHRYVLTAAHCISGQELENYGRLVSVSMGEHDVRNETDCIDSICADPPQTVDILNVYPHPGYIDEKYIRQNDIGLIRLARRVEYSDYVQPICLDKSGLWETGDEVFVAGWGSTLNARDSHEKLKVSLPITNKFQCAQQFRSSFQISLTNSQMCIGGKFLKDACHGDSGGPAMRQKGLRWEAVGLVSFGYGCGRDNWPGIYTVVSSYLDWIKETIKVTSQGTQFPRPRAVPFRPTGNFIPPQDPPMFAYNTRTYPNFSLRKSTRVPAYRRPWSVYSNPWNY